MSDVKCPYCDNVVPLKKARSGQGFPYLRCNKCNILIWFYAGVPNPSSKSLMVEKEKDFMDTMFGV